MVCRVCKKELTNGNICSFCGEDNTPYINPEKSDSDFVASTQDAPKKETKSASKKAVLKRKYKLNKKKLIRLAVIIAIFVIAIVLVINFFKKDSAPVKPEPAENTLFSSGMLAVRVNNEWGYVNIDDTSIFAISPQFSHITNYYQDIAAVCIDGKFSLINKEGNLICEPSFEAVGSFSDNGYIAVKKDGKWGYINKDANFVIEPKFSAAYEFAPNKMAAVCVGGSYGYIGEDGEYTIAPQYDRVLSFTDDKLAAVKIGDKWGYIDDSGNAVIEPQFEEAHSFKNGFAVVKQYSSYGLIDTKGQMAIKPQFDSVFDFSGNYSTVKVGNKYGIINKEGSYIINPSYLAMGTFGEDGLAYAKRGDGMVGFVNEKDEFVIEPTFEDAKNFYLGIAPVKINGLWGYIDTQGNIVIDAKYLDASEFYSEGYAYVRNADNSVSVIGMDGKVAMLESATTIENVLK